MFGGVRALSLLPEVLIAFNISIANSDCSKTLQVIIVPSKRETLIIDGMVQ